MNASPSTLFKRIGAAASVLLLAGALSACSPSSSNQSEAEGGKPKKEMTSEQWQTKFNDCLVDEGVEPPKEDASGMVSFDFGEGEAELMMAATEKCTKKIGERPTSAGEEMTQEDEDRLMEIVGCLRDRGYDIPDPKKGALDMSNANLTPEDQKACFGG